MKSSISKWREFRLARSWARSLGIKSEPDWRRYRKSNELPKDIPSNPDREYKKLLQWTNWSDFLGTGNLRYDEVKRRSYLEAQKWATSQGIKSQKDCWKTPNCCMVHRNYCRFYGFVFCSFTHASCARWDFC